jgi:hypothetical protein
VDCNGVQPEPHNLASLDGVSSSPTCISSSLVPISGALEAHISNLDSGIPNPTSAAMTQLQIASSDALTTPLPLPAHSGIELPLALPGCERSVDCNGVQPEPHNLASLDGVSSSPTCISSSLVPTSGALEAHISNLDSGIPNPTSAAMTQLQIASSDALTTPPPGVSSSSTRPPSSLDPPVGALEAHISNLDSGITNPTSAAMTQLQIASSDTLTTPLPLPDRVGIELPLALTGCKRPLDSSGVLSPWPSDSAACGLVTMDFAA